MGFLNKLSIKTAIIIPSLAVLIAGIIAMVSVTGALSSNTAKSLTGQLMDARVKEYSGDFKTFSQSVYSALKAVTPVVANYIDPEYLRDVDDPRGEVIKILSEVALTDDSIYGIWTAWEPNAFDGKDEEFANVDFYDKTGRFVPYIYKDGDNLNVEALVGYTDPVEGEYYQGALQSGKPYVTDPYSYSVQGTNTLLYSFAMPVYSNGRVAGVVGLDVNLRSAINLMNEGRILDDGYLFMLSPTGLISTYPEEGFLMEQYYTTWMKNFEKQIDEMLNYGGEISARGKDGSGAAICFTGNSIVLGETARNWIICGVVPEKTVNASSSSLLLAIVGIGVALIAVVSLTIFIIVRKSLAELPVLTATAEKIALGDVDSVSLESENDGESKNEIAMFKAAFLRMTAGIQLQAEVLSGVAASDYSMGIDMRSDKDVMNQAINKMLDNTNSILSQINVSAVQVSDGSKQIANAAQTLARGATDQASAIEQLSASIAEIASQTRQNADTAKQAAVLSDTIKGNAEKGSQQMDRMMRSVSEINAANLQIGQVIKVIDEIAFQTNILALNAAVEASKAGMHGKGFAVVAEEVRSLAAKSAAAAKDTEALIENSIEKADLGQNIAKQTVTYLQEIVDGIKRSSEIVKQIAAASDGQSSAITQINSGIGQVVQIVQQNTATAEESAAASEEISGQSELLLQQVEQFKLRDKKQPVAPVMIEYAPREPEEAEGAEEI